ncbi:MAG: GNAT family N-acetyltransferase, partial [Acidimicrobiales bacterium]
MSNLADSVDTASVLARSAHTDLTDTGYAAEHEYEAVVEIDARGFGWRAPEALRERWREATDLERVIVSRDGGDVVGSAISAPTRVTLPGGLRPEVAAVVGVAVSPTHRRQGRLAAMMTLQLEEFRRRREPMAVLSASEGGIYGRFGYGAATFAHRYSLDRRTAALDRSVHSAASGQVRMVEAPQALEAMRALTAEVVLARPGEIEPLGSEWTDIEGLWGADEARQRFFALYEESGRIDGAISYRMIRREAIEPGPRREVLLERMVTVSTPAYIALWRFLLGIDLISNVSTEDRPIDEPIRWCLSDPRQLCVTRLGDQNWLRLVDVETTLSARRYGSEGAITIEVADGLCPWNDGLYHLDAADTSPAESRLSAGTVGATAERIGARGDTSRPADVALDVSTLASIYLGGVDPSAMAAAGRIHAASEESEHLLERLFRVDIAPFCS